MNKKAFAVLFLGALSAALILRVPRLGLRPMHHDEANQAVKFGALLEKGEYRYDRHDHHGPSLYYLTLPFAWASGARTLAQVDEPMLRAVPLAFGAALLLLLLLVRRDMGGHGMLWAGFLLAVSPAFVFYSRFYIQEMVFLFFILGLMLLSGTLQSGAMALFILAYMAARVIPEEMELARRFGDGYKRYRREVPAFFPGRARIGDFLKCLVSSPFPGEEKK